MVRIAVHDRFQHPDDFSRMAFRLGAAGLPVIPRRQVHQRFRCEDGDLVVVGIALGDIHHGIGIGAVERTAVGGRIGCVALGQGFDQRLFVRPCRRRKLLGPHRRRHGGSGGGGIHRRVDVRSQHQRLAPVTHGASWIDLLCLAEGAARFGMVEAIGEPQSLVEVALGLGRCGRDRISYGAEIGPERHVGKVVIHRR